MDLNKKYFVFISYNWQDEEWAKWLRHELEHYHLPASFNDRTDVRDNLREVFRDRDVLNAGPEWDKQVEPILKETNNLIVICSPHAKESDAVEQEIKTFIDLGKEEYIYPLIVEGDKPEDCFPPSLNHKRVGGDVNKDGRDAAFVKIVASMLNVSFHELYNRYEIEKAEQERKEREQKEKLQTVVGRYVGEKAIELVRSGDSYLAATLILEMCNSDMGRVTPEVEKAIRKSLISPKGVLYDNDTIYCAIPSPDDKIVASRSSESIKIWSLQSGALLANEPISNYDGIRKLCFIYNGDRLISTTTKGFEIRDGKTGEKLPGGWYWSCTDRPKHRPLVRDISVNAEETFIAVGLNMGIRGEVWLYDLETCVCENIISLSTEKISSVRFLTNEELFLKTISSKEKVDSVIYIYNIERREFKKASLQHLEDVNSVGFDKASTYQISFKGKSIHICHDEKRTFERSEYKKSEVICIKTSQNGNNVYTISLNNGISLNQNGIPQANDTIQIRDIKNNEIIKIIKTNNSLKGYAIDNKGEYIVTRSPNGSVIVNHMHNNFEKRLGDSFYERVDMIFSPDGKFFVGPSDNSVIGVWETNEWKLLHSNLQESPNDFNPHMCISPDSKYIAGGYNSGEVRIWDILSGVAVDSFNVDGCIIHIKFVPIDENEDSLCIYLNDGTMLSYSWLHVEKLLEIAQERFHDRKLSDKEKKQYYLQ